MRAEGTGALLIDISIVGIELVQGERLGRARQYSRVRRGEQHPTLPICVSDDGRGVDLRWAAKAVALQRYSVAVVIINSAQR